MTLRGLGVTGAAAGTCKYRRGHRSGDCAVKEKEEYKETSSKDGKKNRDENEKAEGEGFSNSVL